MVFASVPTRVLGSYAATRRTSLLAQRKPESFNKKDTVLHTSEVIQKDRVLKTKTR